MKKKDNFSDSVSELSFLLFFSSLFLLLSSFLISSEFLSYKLGFVFIASLKASILFASLG